jgi:hypothetical protein
MLRIGPIKVLCELLPHVFADGGGVGEDPRGTHGGCFDHLVRLIDGPDAEFFAFSDAALAEAGACGREEARLERK